eukprot:scaffold94187_cov52-Attheya_sp.AAC.3
MTPFLSQHLVAEWYLLRADCRLEDAIVCLERLWHHRQQPRIVFITHGPARIERIGETSTNRSKNMEQNEKDGKPDYTGEPLSACHQTQHDTKNHYA